MAINKNICQIKIMSEITDLQNGKVIIILLRKYKQYSNKETEHLNIFFTFWSENAYSFRKGRSLQYTYTQSPVVYSKSS